MKPGDIVKHRPTGETWDVAAVQFNRLAPSGWPETWAEIDDCELLEECTPTESTQVIERWARSSAGPGGDWRVFVNRSIVEARRAEECNRIMRL